MKLKSLKKRRGEKGKEGDLGLEIRRKISLLMEQSKLVVVQEEAVPSSSRGCGGVGGCDGEGMAEFTS